MFESDEYHATISSYQDTIHGYFTDVKRDVDILDIIGVEYTGGVIYTLVFGTIYQAMFFCNQMLSYVPMFIEYANSTTGVTTLQSCTDGIKNLKLWCKSISPNRLYKVYNK